MSRIVLVLDEAGRPGYAAELERARAALVHGGSAERAFAIEGPRGAALLLAHAGSAPLRVGVEAVTMVAGHGADPGEEEERLLRAADAWTSDLGPRPAPPERPWGRRALVRWEPASGRALVVAEPHGLVPLYAWSAGGRTVLASEPKAIAAIAGSALAVDEDALADLVEVGECLGDRTPWRGIRALPPGAVVRLGPDGSRARTWHVPRFSESRGGGVRDAAESLNEALLAVLEAERRRSERATVALSGGMDSRYVLAGSRRLWSDLSALTVGGPESPDASLACRVAAGARVPCRRLPWDGSGLAAWAGYSVWRADGMVGCLHAQGLDALFAACAGPSPPASPVLNGLVGDVLAGTFVRPQHLVGRVDPAGAARRAAALRRVHGHAPEDLLRPEVLRARRSTVEESILGLLRDVDQGRPGNFHLHVWLRGHAARLTAVGLGLEAPFVDWATPLADPAFVAAAARLSLELRLFDRAYRAALARLAPELAAVPWDRFGLAPRLPTALFAAGAVARRLGLGRRPWVSGSYADALRGPALAWARGILLSPGARRDGYCRPDRVERMLEEHASGAADRAAPLGAALTIELWRREFQEDGRDLARPPLEGPAARAPERIAWPPEGGEHA